MKLAAIELAELAAVTRELEPARICTDCGHRADNHDIDRKVLKPSQRPRRERMFARLERHASRLLLRRVLGLTPLHVYGWRFRAAVRRSAGHVTPMWGSSAGEVSPTTCQRVRWRSIGVVGAPPPPDGLQAGTGGVG